VPTSLPDILRDSILPTQRTQICSLRLVYPPISNQEGEWLMRDPEVEADLRQSNIYMIVSRAEGKFINLNADPDNNSLSFEFTAGAGPSDGCHIMINELPGVQGSVTDELRLECGEKIIRIWSAHPDRSRDELLQWFTTEKLLFDRWQGMPGLYGLDRLRDLTTYELLYVGISKTHDAFDRLLVQPHDKRLESSPMSARSPKERGLRMKPTCSSFGLTSCE
jgi:hypothetical protein